MSNLDELRWVRLYSAIHIPVYLVEQVRDRDYTVEDFFKYQEINCTVDGKSGPMLNPLNHLYALVDKNNLVKGFLWFVVDCLSKDLCINTYSVDKEYWCKGRAVSKLEELVKEVMDKQKVKKVFWVTNYPKHSERHGFKRSKSVLMEFRGDKEHGQNTHGEHRAQEEHLDADSRTARTA